MKQIEKRQNEVGEGEVLLILPALAVEHTCSYVVVDQRCFFVACVSCVLCTLFACSNVYAQLHPLNMPFVLLMGIHVYIYIYDNPCSTHRSLPI